MRVILQPVSHVFNVILYPPLNILLIPNDGPNLQLNEGGGLPFVAPANSCSIHRYTNFIDHNEPDREEEIGNNKSQIQWRSSRARVIGQGHFIFRAQKRPWGSLENILPSLEVMPKPTTPAVGTILSYSS